MGEKIENKPTDIEHILWDIRGGENIKLVIKVPVIAGKDLFVYFGAPCTFHLLQSPPIKFRGYRWGIFHHQAIIISRFLQQFLIFLRWWLVYFYRHRFECLGRQAKLRVEDIVRVGGSLGGHRAQHTQMISQIAKPSLIILQRHIYESRHHPILH